MYSETEEDSPETSSRNKIVRRSLFATTVLLMLAGTAVLVFLAPPLNSSMDGGSVDSDSESSLRYEPLDFGSSNVKAGIYKAAAIATDAFPCASVARDILQKPNATSVDAVIASLLCNGVVNAHSMGIGGGFFMTIYDEKTEQAYTIDARSTAPAAANKDMFQGNSTLSVDGGLSIAVPGEIYGYHLAHSRFGGLRWSDLFAPVIRMLREGVEVRPSLANALVEKRNYILADPFMSSVFIDPKTGDVYVAGDNYTNPALADTFEKIASKGYREFYEGEVSAAYLQDVQDRGAIITADDLKNYTALWKEPLSLIMEDVVIHSVAPPSSGALMIYMLNIMRQYNISETVNSTSDELLMWHRFVEAMKWAYARRSELGDPFDPEYGPNITNLVQKLLSDDFAHETRFNISDSKTSNNPGDYGAEFNLPPDDHGTSHISIRGPDGLSIAATNTINLFFGSKVMSASTGIIFNDDMDDFSSPNITSDYGVPPSPSNFIVPGKRMMSSMAPTIIVDRTTKKPKLIIGAAGGTKITTAVAYASLRHLWLNQTIKESIDAAHLHHQLVPMFVDAETSVPQIVLDHLKSKDHRLGSLENFGVSVVGVAVTDDGDMHAMYDSRKLGEVAGFD